MQNLAESDRQPIGQAVFTPPPANPLDPVDHAAEPRLDQIGRERDPDLMVQPAIEEHDGLAGEVLHIRPGLGIAVCGKCGQKIAEATRDRLDQLSDQRFILRRECLTAWRCFLGGRDRPILQRFQDRFKDIPHDRIPVFLQAKKEAIECQPLFWCLVFEDDRGFKVVHGATPPFLRLVEIEGCSPFFIIRQTPSHAFGTSPKNKQNDA